jgi:CMP-N-acetylneuraminic acid synthetase
VKSIDAAILSTDDAEIAAEAERYGLEVPFLRPMELSGDEARSVDVWRHAWLQAEKIHGRTYHISVLLEPTSPLRRADDIERTIQVLLANSVDCCFTVSPTPAHYTPQKTLKIRSDGLVDFFLPASQAQTIRQHIPEYYHRNGVCYAVRRQHLVDRGQIVTPGSFPLVINRPLVNIDEPFELDLANWLHGLQANESGM